MTHHLVLDHWGPHKPVEIGTYQDPQISLDLNPDDYLFQNGTTVYGLDYYRTPWEMRFPLTVDRYHCLLYWDPCC